MCGLAAPVKFLLVAARASLSKPASASCSPASHLHFSIKHPHTLSWEYYTMFQCKAHLVMRLIENRISMEFMLQVSQAGGGAACAAGLRVLRGVTGMSVPTAERVLCCAAGR